MGSMKNKPTVKVGQLGGLDTHEYSHESFGLATFSRVQGRSGPLFGSSIEHQHFIRLTISRGRKHRHLSYDSYSPQEELVEVDMSPTQYADLITGMNVGGHPVTLRRVLGEKMSECPEENKRMEFEKEFEATVKKIMADGNAMVSQVQEILAKPSIGKADREAIFKLAQSITSQVTGHLPFLAGQFNEQMDKSVTEAKGEVEAFVSHKVSSLGIEALKDSMAPLRLAGGPYLHENHEK